MTTLSTISYPGPTSILRKKSILFLARLHRALDNWVAAALAYRARRAALFALRGWDDRELKDIGLYRCQIDETIRKSSRQRMRRRLWQ
jgi:uncharacterized protein YjiS (DUF1127 family)